MSIALKVDTPVGVMDSSNTIFSIDSKPSGDVLFYDDNALVNVVAVREPTAVEIAAFATHGIIAGMMVIEVATPPVAASTLVAIYATEVSQ